MEVTKKHLSLAEIKERLGNFKGELERREFFFCSHVAGGVPRGVISEITGTARTEWMISLLAQNPHLGAFWAEEKLTILPTAIQQRGVELSRILIAETGDKLFHTLRKALKSKLFACVVLPGAIEEVKMLKALQLFARESNTGIFFLSKIPKNAWAIAFQARVDWNEDAKSYAVEVLKSQIFAKQRFIPTRPRRFGECMRVACVFFSQSAPIEEFAQACLRFSPQIAVRAPNVVFIEIGKCLKLYSEESFLARVQVLLRRFKLEARIALSSDIPSALALAHFGQSAVDALPLEALVDFADFTAASGAEPARPPILKMIESLKRLGLKSIADFRALPAAQISPRFGGLGLYCHQRLAGVELPWPHWKPPESYAERTELTSSECCSDLEPLLFKAKEALDRIFSRLRGRFLRAEKIRVSLELEKYSTVKNPLRHWDFEFISPQGSSLGFLPILRERLSRDLQKEPIESFVIAMSFEVVSTVIGSATQRNFFHSRDDFDEAMGSLFGQLKEFLGHEQVFWAQVTEERIPEKSWIKTRKIQVQNQVNGEPVSLTGLYPTRPTRLFKEPLPIRVIQDRIALKGRIYRTLRWSQMERLVSDWLGEEPARDYYRVDLEEGRAFWVFSDPTQGFFLHGYYE